jgi:hypothetical protein
MVSGAGISPDPAKVNVKSMFPIPGSVKEIQIFIELCSYYRRFIKNFAVRARPLIELTKKVIPFSEPLNSRRVSTPSRMS